jgi:hypothetical protein
MDTKRISLVAGTALLALTATASAGPMSVASSQVVTPSIPIEQAHYYYRHHHRYYGGYYGRSYGWHHRRYYRRHYGWNPGAAVAGAALGLATVPFALATGGYYGYYPYGGYYAYGGYYPYHGYYGPYYYY